MKISTGAERDAKFYVLLGFGVIKVGLPGMMPFSIARTAFSTPEIPAAGSEWPMLLLIYGLLD